MCMSWAFEKRVVVDQMVDVRSLTDQDYKQKKKLNSSSLLRLLLDICLKFQKIKEDSR